MDDLQSEVEFRKSQENIKNIINRGQHREYAKIVKAMYDAYEEVGFSDVQAFDLCKVFVSGMKG